MQTRSFQGSVSSRRRVLLGLDDGRLSDHERTHCNRLHLLRRPLRGWLHRRRGEITARVASGHAAAAAPIEVRRLLDAEVSLQLATIIALDALI
jgi:hypothetical protein